MSQTLFEKLRREYPLFVYESFEDLSPQAANGNETDLLFRFTFKVYDANNKEAFCFRPQWKIPARTFYHRLSVDPLLWKRLLFNAGMIELISYWKTVASPRVEIRCLAGGAQEQLDTDALSFWKKIYFNGLGEYFYLNGIDVSIDEFMEINSNIFPNIWPNQKRPLCRIPLKNQVLVPIGGGKDSVVSWHILSQTYRKEKQDLLPMILNPRGATVNCCGVAGFDILEVAVIERSLDPLMLQLNEKGFLNGHTPFSALLAFSVLVLSALTGRKYVALSNESSANESTVQGKNINHQYSKSFEFEEDFSRYVNTYISPDFYYFSFLRPLSELAIARVFSTLEIYHPVFRSCNAGSKQDLWCGRCAKCLFAYIILSPFMSQEKMEKIFGRNMLADISLAPLLDQLCGKVPVKPFECVGTVSEVNWAMQHLDVNLKEALVAYYRENAASLQEEKSEIWTSLSSMHRLPPSFNAALQQYLQNKGLLEWN